MSPRRLDGRSSSNSRLAAVPPKCPSTVRPGCPESQAAATLAEPRGGWSRGRGGRRACCCGWGGAGLGGRVGGDSVPGDPLQVKVCAVLGRQQKGQGHPRWGCATHGGNRGEGCTCPYGSWGIFLSAGHVGGTAGSTVLRGLGPRRGLAHFCRVNMWGAGSFLQSEVSSLGSLPWEGHPQHCPSGAPGIRG